jgi:hypothetical protein
VYIDQSATELRLNVVGGPLDSSQFTFFASDRIRGAALRVHAGIIGASHVFEVRHSRLPVLHEVFACCDVRPPAEPGRRLFSGAIDDIAGAFECEPADGVGYSIVSEQGDLAAGASQLASLEAKVRAARQSPGEIGLSHTFPSPSLPSSPSGTRCAPKTVVWVGLDPDDRWVRVETAHCYPNEQSIVFSRSRIEIDAGPRR